MILSWLSVDNRGPSAVYIVTDSRISWRTAAERWDSGRKTFAATSPDIFGYCGEVLFPSLVLGQFCDLIGRGLVWNEGADAATRHCRLVEFLATSFERRHNAPDHDFSIIHATRDGKALDSVFHVWRTDYQANTKTWQDCPISIGHPRKSKVLGTLGSGRISLLAEISRWNKSPQAQTARAYFAAFFDAIESGVDPRSGGMPQIVSLTRDGAGRLTGVIEEGERYLYGTPVAFVPALANIDWVNRLFERRDPETLARLSNAQRHARVDSPEESGFLKFVRRTSGSD